MVKHYNTEWKTCRHCGMSWSKVPHKCYASRPAKRLCGEELQMHLARQKQLKAKKEREEAVAEEAAAAEKEE